MERKEALEFYNKSKKNYEQLAKAGAESHFAYFRDKHPEVFAVLIKGND